MSDRIDIPRALDFSDFSTSRATWFWIRGGPPMVSCGKCGERASLGQHQIDADGVVSPSLVCPTGCGWHVFARLLDYRAPEIH